MEDNITGKTILLITNTRMPVKYQMRDVLLSLGAKEVVLKNLVTVKGLRGKLSLRGVYHYLRNPHERDINTKNLIEEIGDRKINTLLCVENLQFSKWLLDYLREKNPDVKLVMFFWDKVEKHHKGFDDYFPKFDKIYSFDRDDAKDYGFEYYPDFYFGVIQPSEECTYDIAFVGRIRNDETLQRAFLIRQVQAFCDEYKLKPYLRIRPLDKTVGKKNPIKKILQERREKKYWNVVKEYEKYGFIYYDDIPLDEVDDIYNHSKVILDTAYPGRQGMTLNAIVALAKGKKLITCNKRIKEEPFYDPDMIYILDEDNPHFDMEFFNRPNKKVDMSYLRMDNWLKHLING